MTTVYKIGLRVDQNDTLFQLVDCGRMVMADDYYRAAGLLKMVIANMRNPVLGGLSSEQRAELEEWYEANP